MATIHDGIQSEVYENGVLRNPTFALGKTEEDEEPDTFDRTAPMSLNELVKMIVHLAVQMERTARYSKYDKYTLDAREVMVRLQFKALRVLLNETDCNIMSLVEEDE